MKAQVFVIGRSEIPKQLKKDGTFSCQCLENPYELRELLKGPGEKIVVAFLPFLEVRHFDMYAYLQRNNPDVKTFFIVDELSSNMKTRLKNQQEFVVLWKTEEEHLARDIKSYLGGRPLELRQDKRESHPKRALVTPSLLSPGLANKPFQPLLTGDFGNISLNGSCMQIQAPFYKKKDFISVSYQNKEGEYVSVEAQVRWTQWDEKTQSQKLGVQFLTQG